jgi:hypothetical protein
MFCSCWLCGVLLLDCLLLRLAVSLRRLEVAVLVAGARVVDDGVVGRRVVGVWEGTCVVVMCPLVS